jgi:uncharacterized protein (TIGR02646 family)
MRPVDKGTTTKVYARYQDAVGDLETRLGAYCSYCERPFGALEVEHIQPKKINPALLTSWSNFLLSCKTCNTIKGHQPTTLDGALWPDLDNTFLAVKYQQHGWIEVSSTLDGTVAPKASKLVSLIKLDRHHLALDRRLKPTKRDGRSSKRAQIWDLAAKWKAKVANWNASQRQEALELIRDMALGYGCFSVWMTVFANEPDVCLELISAFTNTAPDCFDATGSPIPRPGGRL